MCYRMRLADLLRILALALGIAGGCFTHNYGHAYPTITTVSGTLTHGNTITISGSGFGAKNPAGPLWWDDGEGAPLNNPSVMTTGDMSWATSILPGGSKHYNDVWPSLTTNLNTRMQYRSVGHRNTSAPHGRSTKFMTGCHDEEGECLGGEPGQDVLLNISDGFPHNVWFVSYYERLDSAWPLTATEGHEQNYKFFVWEATPPYTAYATMPNYDAVSGCSGGYQGLRRGPRCNDGWITVAIVGIMNISPYGQNNAGTCGRSTQGFYPVVTHDTSFKNPLKSWTHVERSLRYDSNYYVVKHDNVTGVDTTRDEEQDCTLGRNKPGPYGGVTIGGFWNQGRCGEAAEGTMHDKLNNNACRYFDDVYVDNTFSRLVLADNSNYASATIVEPQIPFSWSTGSISVKVNLGKLPVNGRAYLFVFDSDNNHNPVGHCVPLGNGSCTDIMPPSPPTGAH